MFLLAALGQLQLPQNHCTAPSNSGLKLALLPAGARCKGRLRTKPVRFSCRLPLLYHIKYFLKCQTHKYKQKPNHSLLLNSWHRDEGQLSPCPAQTLEMVSPAHSNSPGVFVPCSWACSSKWAFLSLGMHYCISKSPVITAFPTQLCNSNWSQLTHYSHWSTDFHCSSPACLEEENQHDQKLRNAACLQKNPNVPSLCCHTIKEQFPEKPPAFGNQQLVKGKYPGSSDKAKSMCHKEEAKIEPCNPRVTHLSVTN